MKIIVITILAYLLIALLLQRFNVFTWLYKYASFELFDSKICKNGLCWPIVIVELVLISMIYACALVYTFIIDFIIEHGYYFMLVKPKLYEYDSYNIRKEIK